MKLIQPSRPWRAIRLSFRLYRRRNHRRWGEDLATLYVLASLLAPILWIGFKATCS